MSDASDARIKALVNALTLKLSEAIENNNDIEIKNIEQKLLEIFESNGDYDDDEYQEMITMRNTNPTSQNGGKKCYYNYKSNKKQFKNRRQRKTKRRQRKTKRRQRKTKKRQRRRI
jgi:hypothetical protein